MLSNYVLTSLRTLRRQPLQVGIGIVGLSAGIAGCVLLALFVQHEWRFDRFHEDADQIVRINRVSESESGERTVAPDTPPPLASMVRTLVPQAEAVTRVKRATVRMEASGKEPLDMDGVYADPALFDVFTLSVLDGEVTRALQTEDSVVLTRSAAMRWFGSPSVTGKTVTVRHEDTPVLSTVAAVVDDMPGYSSLQFDVLVSFQADPLRYPKSMRPLLESWDANITATFARLTPGTDQAAFAEALTQAMDRSGVTLSGNEERTGPMVDIQPLTAVHTSTEVPNGHLEPATSPAYVYLLVAAALLIMLIASINFTSLALARSVRRTLEVGVRKTMGARQSQIRAQFWVEAGLSTLTAIGGGVLLSWIALPFFRNLTQIDVAFDITPALFAVLAFMSVVIAFVSGAYPTVVLSKKSPISVMGRTGRSGGIRENRAIRGLVVVQFAVTVALVVGAVAMTQQMRFMKTSHGLDAKQVIEIPKLSTDSRNQDNVFEPFRAEVEQIAGVESVAGTVVGFRNNGGFSTTIATGQSGDIAAAFLPATPTFADVVGIRMVAGRDLDASRAEDDVMIVNQALVDALGWSDPVGETINFEEGARGLQRLFGKRTVVGVTENIHSGSLRNQVKPLVIVPNESVGPSPNVAYVRVDAARGIQVMDNLRDAWERVVPHRPFDAQWLDTAIASAYDNERRVQKLLFAATGLALLIACMGLFGIAALVVQRRRKEVGIRKALGATSGAIVRLFARDVVRLIGLAFLIGAPFAYWGVSRWLQTFAYRIDVGADLFIAAGGIVFTIALVAVFAQVLRATHVDPALSLRDE